MKENILNQIFEATKRGVITWCNNGGRYRARLKYGLLWSYEANYNGVKISLRAVRLRIWLSKILFKKPVIVYSINISSNHCDNDVYKPYRITTNKKLWPSDEESSEVERLYRFVDDEYVKRYCSGTYHKNIKEELSDWLSKKLSKE